MSRKSIQLGFFIVALAANAAAQTTTNVTNSDNGTTNVVPVYSGAATVTNSTIYASGGNVGIKTSPTAGLLELSAPDQSTESAIAIRQSGNLTNGIDFSLDQNTTGMGYIYGVTGGTKTALEQFDRANKYVLFNGGNVGIGTTTPNAMLQVVDGGTVSLGASGAILSEDTGRFGIDALRITGLDANSSNTGLTIMPGPGIPSTWGADLRIYNAYDPTGTNSGSVNMFFPNATTFEFLPDSFGTGTIPTSFAFAGNVGIGTTTPIATLDVGNGVLHVAGSINPTTASQGAYIGWNALTGGTGETDFINNPGTGSGGFVFMSVPQGGSPRTTVMKISSSGGLTFADNTTQTTAWTGVLCGGDYAEAVDVAGELKHYGPGDVLVITSDDDGDVEKASEPYSTKVVGIYATKPGVIGRRPELGDSQDAVPMAMIGIVPAKVSAENGPIHKGDLLVTASIPGYAMKGTDRSRMLGAVIGKALGSLDSGTGVIEAVVTLQ